MIVAVDGPAGVGKSTVSKCVSKKTGFVYINSGNFYRAITKAILDRGMEKEGKEIIVTIAEECRVNLVDGRVFLDNRDVDDLLHSDEIDKYVAVHSSIPEIREIVNKKLRQAVKDKNAIVEGRDIGTVVFPDAEVKIFLQANLEIRAKRRYLQGTSDLSFDDLKKSIKERDEIDSKKAFGKLEKAEGSILIDTSHLTIEQVCERVVNEILKKQNIRS